MATNKLDPATLAALASGAYVPGFGSVQQWGWQGGDGGGAVNPQSFYLQDAGNKRNNVFDAQGNFLSNEAGGDGSLQQTLAILAAIGGGSALASAFGGAGAGLGAASEGLGTGAGLTANSANAGGWLSAVPAQNAAALASMPAVTSAGMTLPEFAAGAGAAGAAGGAAGGALGAAGGNASPAVFNAAKDSAAASQALGYTGSQLGAIASPAATAVNGATGLLSTLKDYAPLIGAGLGALSGQDQTQSTNRDPWQPAQQWIKDNIAAGQALQTQYTAQPFSQAQQTQYGNIAGLLNAMNSGAGGLLAGMSANASGANNYDRANPRKALQGSSFNLSGFNPGLLSFFPKGG